MDKADSEGKIFGTMQCKDRYGRPVLLFRNEWKISQVRGEPKSRIGRTDLRRLFDLLTSRAIGDVQKYVSSGIYILIVSSSLGGGGGCKSQACAMGHGS